MIDRSRNFVARFCNFIAYSHIGQVSLPYWPIAALAAQCPIYKSRATTYRLGKSKKAD